MSSREPNSAGAPAEPLTRREREILVFLDEGFSAPEIA
jgi:DNA-binding NarL/FixJ family response regulator